MGIYLRKLLQPIMSENGDPYFKDRLARRLREELGAMMSDEGVPNDELRSYYVPQSQLRTSACSRMPLRPIGETLLASTKSRSLPTR